MELFEALGLNTKILIAQFLNFAIMVFVLWRFAYKPILKFLESRRQKIEEGVKNSERAIEKLTEVGEKERQVIVEAKKEALEIINESKADAEKKAREILEKAEKDASLVMDKEREKLEQERLEMFKELKGKLSGLVVLAVEKVLKEKIDEKKDAHIIEEALKD
jgi:F-type H+-transporting ATPase subunit b